MSRIYKSNSSNIELYDYNWYTEYRPIRDGSLTPNSRVLSIRQLGMDIYCSYLHYYNVCDHVLHELCDHQAQVTIRESILDIYSVLHMI